MAITDYHMGLMGGRMELIGVLIVAALIFCIAVPIKYLRSHN